ncbi:MAG: LytTR family transcriptional regulator DNA-binding domain-containing protein [Defluviitaleaceae bacterium]|nr:LytTR family transcriptional regulator DNA-binding domain-containing protein [Defluviitaleaceae bacterium]
MIIKLMQDSSLDEVEVIIKYAEMDKNVERVVTMLQSTNTRIKCNHEGREMYVSVSDIYYFESVDKMTFVYGEKDVYRTDLRLYQIVDEYAHLGLVQISKSCVLNINVLESITPLFNSRMEATLKNSERLYVTRRYLESIRQALQEAN